VAGMTNWLKRHDFSYKWTKGQPAKADTENQAKFVADYEELKEKTPKNEPIFFIDGVHPTMATKSTRGWITKGFDKIIPTTASRTRMNIMGAIELSTMNVFHSEHETINAQSVAVLFAQLKHAYPTAKKLHIILDQAGYHRSEELAMYAEANNIQLHFLPPYSPNLNPIERLWKVMNEEVRNNRYFKSAKEFRESIRGFFSRIPELTALLKSRITDNFRVISTAN
jgi:transposase